MRPPDEDPAIEALDAELRGIRRPRKVRSPVAKAASRSAGQPWWVGLRGHNGEPLTENETLFADPPPDIGNVLSAATTLKRGKRPMHPPFRRLLIAVFGVAAGLGVEVLLLDEWRRDGYPGSAHFVAILAAVSIGALVARFTRFRHRCTYVGDRGLARFESCNSGLRVQCLRFADAATLRQTEVCSNDTGDYTSFSYVWVDALDRPLFAISGGYGGGPATPVYFAGEAASAWRGFARRHNEQAARSLNDFVDAHGKVRFELTHRGFIVLGPDGIVLSIAGRMISLAPTEIRRVSLHRGVFEITSAAAGWFGDRGRYRFKYSDLDQPQAFMFVVEAMYGMEVDVSRDRAHA